MNIIEKQKLLRETVDIIKTSVELFGAEKIYELTYPVSGRHTLIIKFNEKTRFELKYDLFNNYIFINSGYNAPFYEIENEKYEELLKEYNLICATPKKTFSHLNGIIQHNFKISEANCKRLYDIFTIIAKTC